jgi:lysophospholipase L1-like esterase
VQEADVEPPYDVVSLQVGVNDQYRGHDLEEFAAPLHDLLALATRLASDRPDRVVVLSIPDWTVTPHGADRDRNAEARSLHAYNRRLRAEAERAGCRWVDVTAISQQAGDETGLLAPDDLHPSAEMYRRWLETIVPAVEAALTGG